MSRFDEVIGMIEDGIHGRNKGLPHGFERFKRIVPNIQKGTYYTIGGETGSGKTALTDNCFLYSPYDYMKNKDIISLKVLYFSLEIDYNFKLIKGISRRLWIDHGIDIAANEILSRGNYKIEPFVRKLIDGYKGYFEQLEDTVDIYDESYTPEAITRILKEYVEANGKWRRNEKGESKWIANDPNKYTIVILDHVGLITSGDKKKAIDAVSKKLIYYRNKCGIIPVVVSQFNRSISSSDRFKIERVEPQLSDFKDTSSTQEDANVVLGLFAPYRYGQQTYKEYNISKLRGEFRALHILKNRDGDDNAVLGLKFKGKSGHFEEYPLPKDMKYDN
jgi:replicative DNA helicase